MTPPPDQTPPGRAGRAPTAAHPPDPVRTAAVLTVPIRRERVRRTLLLGVAALAALHLLGAYARYVLQRGSVYGTIDRFHLDGEANVPAWYGTLLLLGGAAAVALIAAGARAGSDPFARHWAGLAVLLLFMAADEGAQFHELLARPTYEAAGGMAGWAGAAWVVPGALLALAIGLAYLRFLAHLPRPTARRFVAAGALFLAGALGLEAAGGRYLAVRGDDLGYVLLAGTEEVLEMVGAIVALDAALAHLAVRTPVVRLALGGLGPGAASARATGAGRSR